MSTRTRRLGLRLDAELYDRVAALALESQVGVATAARRALRRSVEGARTDGAEHITASQDSVTQLQLISLAALIGVEQLRAFLANVYPDGGYRMLELREDAAAAAELHLEELKQHLDSEPAV